MQLYWGLAAYISQSLDLALSFRHGFELEADTLALKLISLLQGAVISSVGTGLHKYRHRLGGRLQCSAFS